VKRVVFCPDAGGIFVLFYGRLQTPTERHNMSKSKKAATAKIVWFEIPADNPQRAQKFYTGMFGWEISPFPGMKGYRRIETGGADDSPNGGMIVRKHDRQPTTNYLSVPSVTRGMGKVGKLGGTVCIPKTAVPGMGYYAV
jgi:uncharacterized protein